MVIVFSDVFWFDIIGLEHSVVLFAIAFGPISAVLLNASGNSMRFVLETDYKLTISETCFFCLLLLHGQ